MRHHTPVVKKLKRVDVPQFSADGKLYQIFARRPITLRIPIPIR